MPNDYFQQFRQQLQRNMVAIISLLTALSGLYYDSWRDHQNELNLNTRNAAFEVLKSLGELQTIVNYAHFDHNPARGHPLEGWKHVLLVRDLSHLLPASNMRKSADLYATWEENWEAMQTNPSSEFRISQRIAQARSDVLQTIKNLQ